MNLFFTCILLTYVSYISFFDLIAGGRFHKSYICRLTFKKRLFTEDTKYELLGYIQLPTRYINLKTLEVGIKKLDDDPSEAKTC